MALIDELKERYDKLGLKIDQLTAECGARLSAIKEIQRERRDLAKAYVALEPSADAAPQPDQQASALEDAKRIEGASEVVPVPGAGEESRDQLCSVEGCEIHADDASEFSEEGYAPVIEAEPLADPIWNEPEPEPTKPEADSIAKAHDYYDPKAVAERERFNPFNIFKREGDQ